MDFTIQRAALLGAISKCAIAIEKSKNPILAFTVMLVETREDGTVRFAAAGERCSVDTTALADVKKPGMFRVSPSAFKDVIDKMPPGTIQISLNAKFRVTVKSKVSNRSFSFADRNIDIQRIEDPGPDAAWLTVRCSDVLAAFAHVKYSSVWIYEDGRDGFWLVRDEPLAVAFATNNYTVSIVSTGIRMPQGEPVFLPLLALDALALMAVDDQEVRLFQDERKLYIESRDTLVSAALSMAPQLVGLYGQMKQWMTPSNATPGPTIKVALLRDALRAVLASSRFGESTREGRGERVHLALTPGSARLEIVRSEADAFDEFDTDEPGSPMDFYLSSVHLDGALASIGSVESVQVLKIHNAVLLHSGSVSISMAEERPEQ